MDTRLHACADCPIKTDLIVDTSERWNISKVSAALCSSHSACATHSFFASVQYFQRPDPKANNYFNVRPDSFFDPDSKLFFIFFYALERIDKYLAFSLLCRSAFCRFSVVSCALSRSLARSGANEPPVCLQVRCDRVSTVLRFLVVVIPPQDGHAGAVRALRAWRSRRRHTACRASFGNHFWARRMEIELLAAGIDLSGAEQVRRGGSPLSRRCAHCATPADRSRVVADASAACRFAHLPRGRGRVLRNTRGCGHRQHRCPHGRHRRGRR